MQHKVTNSEDVNDIDSRCTNGREQRRKNSVSHKDQDSDVSFESDKGEEIDAAEIEEEDWVDYIERSTEEAMEKMEHEKISIKKMETGDEKCHITEREMAGKS